VGIAPALIIAGAWMIGTRIGGLRRDRQRIAVLLLADNGQITLPLPRATGPYVRH